MIEDMEYIFEDLLSDEDDVINIIDAPRRPKVIRNRIADMHYWVDTDFLNRFRISKQSVQLILDLVHGELAHTTNQNYCISPLTQLLLALRFYATGSTEMVVGDFVGVSESASCQIVNKVSQAIARLAPQYIKMPTTDDELETSKRMFQDIANFPNVIGAIDCTHVRIQSPGGENAEHYRNRKGYFSINVQTVSNAKLKFINIVARWPGSVHDRTVFENSRIKGQFEEEIYPHCFLLGDSGYTLTKYMMTPLLATNTRAEALYNESQIRTRNIVERKYGVWKRRFPVLRLELRLKLDRTLAVIVATAVLHNIAMDLNDDEPEEDHIAEDVGENNPEALRMDGVQVRNSLINDYFANL